MWRTRNKNVSPNMRHGRGAAVAPETSGHRCGRRVESLFGGRPCRWKHFLLDNHLREKGTATFSIYWNDTHFGEAAARRWWRRLSTRLQSSGDLHLILKLQLSLRERSRRHDLIFFFFAELIIDLSWWLGFFQTSSLMASRETWQLRVTELQG